MDVVQLLDTCIAVRQVMADDQLEVMFGVQALIGGIIGGKDGAAGLEKLVEAMQRYVQGS